MYGSPSAKLANPKAEVLNPCLKPQGIGQQGLGLDLIEHIKDIRVILPTLKVKLVVRAQAYNLRCPNACV